jgi:hypothetical protein
MCDVQGRWATREPGLLTTELPEYLVGNAFISYMFQYLYAVLVASTDPEMVPFLATDFPWRFACAMSNLATCFAALVDNVLIPFAAIPVPYLFVI